MAQKMFPQVKPSWMRGLWGNVEVIIQINELIVLDRGIDNESRHDQEQSGDPLLVISKGAQSSHLPGLELLQIRARFRVVGVAFDSLLKVLDRLLKISFLSQHRSQIIMSFSVIRVEFQGHQI